AETCGRMGWFRSKKRWGSWCAIFALAMQLVVTFGHVHVEGFVSFPGLISSIVDPGQNASHDATDGPASPRKHLGYGHYCGLCAGLQSVGLLAAAPPAPVPLTTVAHALSPQRIETALTAALSVIFQARGPPFA